MKYSLMFHHFHDENSYPNYKGGGSISASNFHSIIDYIEKEFNLITPDEFSKKVMNNSISDNDVCLTFDDSLKCQFEIVYKELEKRNLKAFFFIYSGVFFENPPLLEFFRDFRFSCFDNVDEYFELFFKTIELNHNVDFKIFQKKYRNDYLSKFPFYSNNDKKYRFLRDVILKDKYFDVVISMMNEKKYSISDRKDYLFMSIDNLRKLSETGHTLGLHSHSHPTTIQRLNYSSQLEEYSKNYEFVQSITKEKIFAMSHPCGNYNHDTLNILKKLGINIGFRSSLFPSNITSRLEIPREDHANIMKIITKNENNSIHQ